jgi:hypothetical protein
MAISIDGYEYYKDIGVFFSLNRSIAFIEIEYFTNIEREQQIANSSIELERLRLQKQTLEQIKLELNYERQKLEQDRLEMHRLLDLHNLSNGSILRQIIQATCPICIRALSELTQAELVSTPCGHLFCYTCIHEWIITNQNCPICRKATSIESIHSLFIN